MEQAIKNLEQALVAQLGGDRGRALAQTVAGFVLDAFRIGIEQAIPAPFRAFVDNALAAGEGKVLQQLEGALQKVAPPPSSSTPPAGG